MSKIDEIWKEIDGYKGLYEVSNTGKVKFIERKVLLKRPNQKPFYIVKKSGISRPSYDKRGYPQTILTASTGKRTSRRIHRLVAQAFIPNPENKREVNHIDGNKLNNNVSNLEWATSKENTNHAFAIGIKKPLTSLQHAKSIKVVHIESGKLFHSISEAEKDFGLPKNSLARRVKIGDKLFRYA